MQLKEIDPVRLQPFQRRVGRARNGFRRKILRDLALTASARLTVMNKIVANLCRNHDLIPLIRESFRDQFFAQSVSVRVSGIEERDAEIKRFVHQRDRFALGKISPPTCRNRPQTKADFADSQIGILVSAKLHKPKINHRGAEVTERIWTSPSLCPLCSLW